MVRHPETTPLAIIGMGCSLPGAESIDEYWQLILEGRCAIDELPPDRFDRSLYFDPRKEVRGKSYSSVGALASWPDCDLLPAEVVKNSDRAQMAFCQIASNACRHAGLDVAAIPYRNTGVYVGHTNGTPDGGSIVHATLVEQTAAYLNELDSYQQATGDQADVVIEEIVREVRMDSPRRNSEGGPFVHAHQAAALVSRALNLNGPAMVVNAACASSLIALAMAARALEQNQIDMAIVGGVSFFKADSLILFSKAQSVSANTSRPFDEKADGLIVGEGCAAVAIRRLDRALADNNPIQAVIRGIGISSDGKGKSLWAPRKEGQVAAMQRAYGSSPDFSTLGYVEAHATSTQVGDATELSALCEVLESRSGNKVPIGSVKANIGHTLEVAGVAGLIKSVLAIQHKTIPPAIHVERLNPKIDWNDAPRDGAKLGVKLAVTS